MHHNQPQLVFIGRFQPLHLGHVQMINDLLKQVDYELVVVIGSSNLSRTLDNPWNLEERKLMFSNLCLPKLKILHLDDVDDDQVWWENLKAMVPNLVGVYSGNDWVIDICRLHQVRFYKINTRYQNLSATMIRNALADNQPIDHMVDSSNFNFINHSYDAFKNSLL